jgi:ribosomal protein L22
MTPDETPKDDVTPEEIEAKASEEAAASQPAPKKKPAAKKPAAKKADKAEEAAAVEAVEAEASDEATETKPSAAAGRRGGERSETGKPRKPAADKPAAEKKPAAKKPSNKQPEAPSKPAARAASRGRNGRRPAAEPAVLVRAQAKYVRTSARKARLVCDHIRGKDVAEARAILAFTPRNAAKAWSKLLESAVANAENNHELVGEELRIHSVVADEGPTLKRFRPRAMGRATRIRKRTSHLTITLTPKES